MSYRYRLAIIPNDMSQSLRDCTPAQWMSYLEKNGYDIDCEEGFPTQLYEVFSDHEIFDLGQNFTVPADHKISSFFTNEKVQDYLSHYNSTIVDMRTIDYWLNVLRAELYNRNRNFMELLNPENKPTATSCYEASQIFQRQMNDWEFVFGSDNIAPCSMSDAPHQLVKYLYFEGDYINLLFIKKTLDLSNGTLIYYGW